MGRKGEGAYYPHLQGFFGLSQVRAAEQFVDIWLNGAFNMVSFEKSVKFGNERSTLSVPTIIKFQDVSLNWRPQRHNPTHPLLPPFSPPTLESLMYAITK